MEFRVLGPLQVRDDAGELVRLQPLQVGVMSALLVAQGPLNVADLLACAWDDGPRNAQNAVETCMAKLRFKLGEHRGRAEITHDREGGNRYTLTLNSDDCDLEEFGRLRAQARAHEEDGDWADALDLYRSAVGLWRERPLPGRPLPPSLRGRIARLQEDYLDTVLETSRLAAGLGREVGDVVGRLRELQTHYPGSQPLTLHLARALQAQGRGNEALRELRQIRRYVAESEGVDVSPELELLYQELLDPAALARDPVSRPAAPAPPRHLTGRKEEVEHAVRALEEGAATMGGPPATVLLTGAPGIGKTALARAISAQAAPNFPGGQVYFSLDPDRSPRGLVGVLLRLLRVSGGLPPDDAERITLLRRLVTERPHLLVLDNVQQEGQVRAALEAPWAGVLITSRYLLRGLEQVSAVRTVGELSSIDSELLLKKLAPEAVAEDSSGAQTVARLCAGHPLALQIAGAQLAWPSGLTSSELGQRLEDEHERLDALQVGDLAVRAAFRLTYDHLSAPARKMFRHLGAARRLGLRRVDAWIAAVASGTAISSGVRSGLNELVDAHLVEIERAWPGRRGSRTRYRLHDLLGVFAGELFDEEDTNEAPVMLDRLVLAYLGRAQAGEEVLAFDGVHPCGRQPLTGQNGVGASEDPAQITAARSRENAEELLSWLQAERDGLSTLAAAALEAGRPGLASTLARASMPVMEAGAHWDRWQDLVDIARAAARQSGNTADEAAVDAGESTLRHYLGDLEEAQRIMDRALDTYRSMGDRSGSGYGQVMQAMTLRALGLSAQGALAQAQEAATALDDPVLQVEVLRCEAWQNRDRGEAGAAATRLHRARTLAEGLPGTGRLLGYVLHDLGVAYRDAHDLNEARAVLNQALAVFESLHDRHWSALTRYRLSEVDVAAGDLAAARERLEEALTHFHILGDTSWQANAHRSLGVVFSRLDQPDEAIANFEIAAELADIGLKHRSRAIIDVVWAEHLESVGDSGAAITHFAAADQQLQVIGVQPWAARAAGGLRRAKRHL